MPANICRSVTIPFIIFYISISCTINEDVQESRLSEPGNAAQSGQSGSRGDIPVQPVNEVSIVGDTKPAFGYQETQQDPYTEPVVIVPVATDPNLGISNKADTARPPDANDIQIAENYFATQTEVVISDLEVPCPSQDPDRCLESSQAKPEYDQSNKGIYKGVITGEYSGNILLSIGNDFPDQLEASLNYHNDSFQVPLSEFEKSNGIFEYRFVSSDYDFGLVIASDGEIVQDSTVLYVPDGKTAVVTIAKERSDQVVEVFEGTFEGDFAGLWNYINIGYQSSEGYYREASTGTGGVVMGKPLSEVTIVGRWQSDDLDTYWGLDFGFRDGDTVWGTWYLQNLDSGISGQWKGVKTR